MTRTELIAAADALTLDDENALHVIFDELAQRDEVVDLFDTLQRRSRSREQHGNQRDDSRLALLEVRGIVMQRAWMLAVLFLTGCSFRPDFHNPQVWDRPEIFTMTSSSSSTDVGSTYAEYAGWSGRGSLTQLAEELKKQIGSKHDYVADSRTVSVMRGAKNEAILGVDMGDGTERVTGTTPVPEDDDDDFGAGLIDEEFVPVEASGGFDANFGLTSHAFGQLAQRCDVPIPTTFARKLWEGQPETAVELFNAQLQRGPKKFLVRTLNGNCRAVMSDRYRVIDHWDLAEVAMQIAQKQSLCLLEASLTDSHMRLKFTTPEVVETIDEARHAGGGWYSRGIGSQQMLSRVAANSSGPMIDRIKQDANEGTVHPVITISNSETGQGGLNVRSGILRAFCFNLATVETILAKTHLGGTLGLGELSADTVQKKNVALVAELSDTMKAICSPPGFRTLCERLQKAADVVIPATKAAVDNVIKLCDIGEGHADGILQSLLQGYAEHGTSNAYGVAQAVSEYSQEIEDGNVAEALEDAAGQILTSPARFSS